MLRKFLATSIPLVAVLLVMLLGWGFDDWRGYFANAARSALMVFAIAGVGVAVFLRLDLNPLRQGCLPTRRQSLELLALTLSSLGLIWFLPFADRRQLWVFAPSQLYRYAGLLFCGAGLVIRLSALANLGEQFSAYVTLQQDHRLIQTGIYGLVRHPLYLSLMLAGPGFALVFDSRMVWPIIAVTAGFIAVRIRQEEKLLSRVFGASFYAYKKRTWMVLPPLL